MTIPLHQRRATGRLISSLILAALFLVTLGYVGISSYPVKIALVNNRTDALPKYGIAAGSFLTSRTTAEIDDYFDGLKSAGAGWVRFDFDWSTIQPESASAYNWGRYDQIVDSASAHNLKVAGIIDFTPTWARPADCNHAKQCHPADNAAFAKFAQETAARYKKRGVHTWEIWNEANTENFWKPAPDVKRYSKLLIAASTAIHAVDSEAILISASTAPAETSRQNISPADFISGLYSSGAKVSFDAVGVHPYTYPLLPTETAVQAWANMTQGPKNIREIMIKNHDASKKVWLTEFGAPTDGPGPSAQINDLNLKSSPSHIDEALQAKSLVEAMKLYRNYTWAGPIFWYSYQDAGTTTDSNENFFGLVRADGSRKPAFDEYTKAVKIE